MTTTVVAPRVVQSTNDDDPRLALRIASDRGWGHPQTLRRYIHEGKLPAVKIGKQFMVRESDLERLVSAVPVDTDAAAKSAADGATAEGLDDLAALAARMVATWPRLSDERKRELGALLAA